eukprot:TRINITY_DN7920_c0_g1_i1.p1 TRINITY_DN7920_c0_g1~~TRINITY_DN7920_c0_g1_i1.p1  ORF type:complete len:438 (+),score=55.84 TRINITY_DN7920_c0_g1_i1:41-1354(+)
MDIYGYMPSMSRVGVYKVLLVAALCLAVACEGNPHVRHTGRHTRAEPSDVQDSDAPPRWRIADTLSLLDKGASNVATPVGDKGTTWMEAATATHAAPRAAGDHAGQEMALQTGTASACQPNKLPRSGFTVTDGCEYREEKSTLNFDRACPCKTLSWRHQGAQHKVTIFYITREVRRQFWCSPRRLRQQANAGGEGSSTGEQQCYNDVLENLVPFQSGQMDASAQVVRAAVERLAAGNLDSVIKEIYFAGSVDSGETLGFHRYASPNTVLAAVGGHDNAVDLLRTVLHEFYHAFKSATIARRLMHAWSQYTHTQNLFNSLNRPFANSPIARVCPDEPNFATCRRNGFIREYCLTRQNNQFAWEEDYAEVGAFVTSHTFTEMWGNVDSCQGQCTLLKKAWATAAYAAALFRNPALKNGYCLPRAPAVSGCSCELPSWTQ